MATTTNSTRCAGCRIDEARRLMSFQTERQIVEEALPMVGQ